MSKKEVNATATHIALEHFTCRICGYLNDIPIWNDFGDLVLNENNDCPCCGIHWGEEDNTLLEIRTYRTRWLDGGAEWVWPAIEPEDWEVEHQLVNIARSFR